MKMFLFILAIIMCSRLAGQTAADTLEIRKAALDYVEGWAAGDVGRIQSAVSPEISKRRVSMAGDIVAVQDMSRSLLCASALANKKGVRMQDLTPGKDLLQEVKILDIEGSNASVKTWNAKYGFFDYLHLSKAGGKWTIYNVLWDLKAKQ